MRELLNRIPEKYSAYHEPFIGAGSLYFAISHAGPVYISDSNPHLTTTYQALRDFPEEVIAELKTHQNLHSKEYFLELREKLSEEQPASSTAALFIYLNKACFNGVFRVNRHGHFTGSFGRFEIGNIADEGHIKKIFRHLQNTHIACHGFEETLVCRNHFYYLDPPYDDAYDRYTVNQFGKEKQIQLAAFCRTIHKAGGYFMLSNSDTPFVRKLYRGFRIEVISSRRSVSCRASGRGRARELIIRNY